MFIVMSLAAMVIHCCIWFEQKSQFWNIYILMILQSLHGWGAGGGGGPHPNILPSKKDYGV